MQHKPLIAEYISRSELERAADDVPTMFALVPKLTKLVEAMPTLPWSKEALRTIRYLQHRQDDSEFLASLLGRYLLDKLGHCLRDLAFSTELEDGLLNPFATPA